MKHKFSAAKHKKFGFQLIYLIIKKIDGGCGFQKMLQGCGVKMPPSSSNGKCPFEELFKKKCPFHSGSSPAPRLTPKSGKEKCEFISIF